MTSFLLAKGCLLMLNSCAIKTILAVMISLSFRTPQITKINPWTRSLQNELDICLSLA